MTGDFPVVPNYWDDTFMKVKKFSDLEFLELQYANICHMLENQKNNKLRFPLIRRKNRLEKQIELLKESIKIDIEQSKKEL